MFNRFHNDTIREGLDSQLLLDNPVFINAVNRVLNKYAELEEDVLTDTNMEAREVTAKIKQYAMMRRSLLDAVKELDSFVLEGSNASYDKEQFGE